MCADKDTQTSILYDINGEENTSRMPKKKKKSRDGYFIIYECRKHLLHSTYEHACTAQEKTISHIKEMVESFNFKTKEIRSTNREMQTYIDCCKKEGAAIP